MGLDDARILRLDEVLSSTLRKINAAMDTIKLGRRHSCLVPEGLEPW